MSGPPSSTVGAGQPSTPTGILDSTVLPALRLAKVGAIGIGVPGVEGALNGVLELAEMLSTMKANKEDVSKLQKMLQSLTARIDASGAVGDLKQRLTTLSSELKVIARECESFAQRKTIKKFFTAKDDKEKIQGIENSIASQIRQFTFHGNISIEKKLQDMASRELLSRLKCVAARYNAANTPEKCMDGTRVDVIKDILTRLTNPPDPSQRVVMLSGPAGSGKSTIAKTVASTLAEQEGILAASFFFSRDYAERKEIKHLATTLAAQLADYSAVFRAHLVDLLENDHTGLLEAEPQLQFQKLVVQILGKMPPSPKSWVICLDALDECGKDRGQIFLRWLSDSIAQIPAHIQFFLTGRPDVPSYLKFDSLLSLLHGIRLDKIDTTVVKQDIHLYLKQSLDGAGWTPRKPWKIQSQDVEEITNRASGLFVFAATAVRYVLGGLPHVLPQESVDYLLGGEPLTDLHSLYLRIVNEAIPLPPPGDRRAQGSHDRVMKIISTILHLLEPLDFESLAALLDLDTAVVQGILLPLSAVIQVSDTPGAAIRIIHLSFREFMISQVQISRLDLLCGTEHQQQSLVSALMKVMHKKLRFNICDLPTSFLRNVDMPDFEWRVNTYIPLHLQYACQFWVEHLTATSYNSDTAKAAETVLFAKFLFWIEVLSLLGRVDHGSWMLSKIIVWANEDSGLVKFATDGKRFISFFRDAITKSAPHIYISALALAPAEAEIRRKFLHQFPQIFSILRGQMMKWPELIAVLEGHTNWVTSLVLSPDGKQIVSGSHDKTVRIWDAETGATVGEPLEGHTNWVTTVAFSPNGKQIVSGSYDKTVRIWDAEAGAAGGEPLEGHTNVVTSVAFSPDGKQIVSGSWDKTVRIWDAETRAIVGEPLEGHTHWVTSVAFSPNGKQIVSGSDDYTVRIWDAETGAAVGAPLEGHTSLVTSVAFSPDGKQMVSGSDDNTLRIWDAETGAKVGEPLEGHTNRVTAVTFSPDGKQIVSGSRDKTVRIWDAETRAVVRESLEGHTTLVTSVAFSPNGKRIVSGSDDYTVCIWDAETAATVGEPLEGHTHWVTSVTFSPDGKQIVSGSDDYAVCIWDEETGAIVGEPPEGHTNYVTSVAFSPDGMQIVSGSYDETVRIWDAKTGATVGEPLEGHTNSVTSVAFSPDGKQIVSGSDDYTVHVWDAETGATVGEPLEGHTNRVTSVAFSPDGKQIISGSHDETVRIWDAETGAIVGKPLEGHTNWVTSVAFSPDGKQIVSGSHDETLYIWDAETGAAVGEPLEGHTNRVTSVAFSPDGKQIVSGSWDKTVRIWDAETRAAVGEPLEGHTDGVTSVAFSPDGKQIVSGSADKMIRVWHVDGVVYGPHLLQRSTTASGWHLLNSLHMKSPSTRLNWQISGGWVSCIPSEPLFWVPASLRNGLWSPYSTQVIGRHQATKLTYEHFVYGTDWAKCYVPPQSI